MAREQLVAAGAAPPAGPFSAGIKSGQSVFVAGQVPIDAQGKTVAIGDIRGQTRQVLRNMQAVLEAGGATFDDVVKVTVFMTDVSQMAGVQEVRQEFFKAPHPASTMVQVSQLISPDWLLEIEAIAVIDR
ncbi:MAG: RidA family protein [Chloroflexi bacterium]|nr:RidA family protein [Chloroflexota bacterium]